MFAHCSLDGKPPCAPRRTFLPYARRYDGLAASDAASDADGRCCQHGRSKADADAKSAEERDAERKRYRQYLQFNQLMLDKVSGGASGGGGGHPVRGSFVTGPAQRAKGHGGEDALKETSLLLRKNPDHYTAWNWRREILGPILAEGCGSCHQRLPRLPRPPTRGPCDANRAPTEARDVAVREELALTQEALVRGNPKSYPAWFHRRWLVDACVAGVGIRAGSATARLSPLSRQPR